MNITVSLIAQMAAFVALIWLVNRYLWAPLSKVLGDRQARIADGLAAAEKGKHDLELAEKRVIDELKKAKEQAAEILARAEKRASEIVEEAKGDARVEAERLITGARAEIDQEVNRVKEQLRAQLSELALTSAGKILDREIDSKAHEDILKKAMTEI